MMDSWTTTCKVCSVFPHHSLHRHHTLWFPNFYCSICSAVNPRIVILSNRCEAHYTDASHDPVHFTMRWCDSYILHKGYPISFSTLPQPLYAGETLRFHALPLASFWHHPYLLIHYQEFLLDHVNDLHRVSGILFLTLLFLQTTLLCILKPNCRFISKSIYRSNVVK